MLNTSIHPTNTHGLSHRIIYHHLLISSRSPPAPLDRSLSLIMYTAIYPLTPISQRIPQHNLHLFLNPYKGSPYLQYTYEGGRHHQCPVSAQRLTIYISLSSALLFHQVTKMTMCDAHHVSHAWPGSNNHLSSGIRPALNDHTDLGHPYAPVDASSEYANHIVEYCAVPTYPTPNNIPNIGDSRPQTILFHMVHP